MSLVPEQYHEKIAAFCKNTFNKTVSEKYVLDKILFDPQNTNKILKIYKINVSKKDLVLTKIKSEQMNKKRNSAEWYKLVDELKALKIEDGIIGKSKEDFIVQNGTPDKEYRVNENTIILSYIGENRENIPLYSSTSSLSFSNGMWNSVGWTAMGMGNSSTLTSGGYLKTNRWETIIFVDKGIVTGVSRRDLISTE